MKYKLVRIFNLTVIKRASLFMCISLHAITLLGQKTLGLIKNDLKPSEQGYILFAPLYCKTTYLIDRCGKKVQEWKSNYEPGYSAYLLPDGHLLRTGHVKDTHFSFSGKGGIIEKIDWTGKVVWSYKISNDTLAQHHDIKPMANGHILVIAWHKIPVSQTLEYGRMANTVEGPFLASERIIEIEPIGIDEAKVVWQWSLWDHIAQDIDPSKPNYCNLSEHPELVNVNYAQGFPDWIHCNAIDYNEELDQIILSNHRMHEIWIIDHSTTMAEAASHKGGKYNKGGDLLFRWGNPLVYNMGTPMDQKLFDQHNVQWIPKGLKDEGHILLFNNGNGRESNYSSVDIIKLPLNKDGSYKPALVNDPANPIWTYTDKILTNFHSVNLSGAQRLPNGNTLITSGVHGKFFEINQQKETVWEYKNPVALGDTILNDGKLDTKNKVFKCLYYPYNYSAFKNQKFLTGIPIERNPMAYTCNLKAKKRNCIRRKSKI